MTDSGHFYYATNRLIYKYSRYTLPFEYSIFDIMTCSSSDYICALNCDWSR